MWHLRRRALARLDERRLMRDVRRREKHLTLTDAKLQRAARLRLTVLAEGGLFEPLNRQERRLWEKLSRRGELAQWYARRLAQVGENRLIPYVRDYLAAT